MRPTYPDLIRRDQIQAYLRKQTGVLVSKQRIGRWIAKGELRTVAEPCAGGNRWYVTRRSLEALIRRYAD